MLLNSGKISIVTCKDLKACKEMEKVKCRPVSSTPAKSALMMEDFRLPSDHPPTPLFRLPILGHFHLLVTTKAKDTTTELYELYRKYGKEHGAMSLFLGTTKITIIGNF